MWGPGLSAEGVPQAGSGALAVPQCPRCAWHGCAGVPRASEQEGSFLLQRAERNDHPSQTPGPSSALLPGEVLSGAQFAVPLIQFPSVLPHWWHHLQWHSELGITAVWLMARTFALLGEVLLLSLYNLMEISSWKLSTLLSGLSMVKETLRSVPPTRAVFTNSLQKQPDLF